MSVMIFLVINSGIVSHHFIPRAISAYPDIELHNQEEKELFVAVINRHN